MAVAPKGSCIWSSATFVIVLSIKNIAEPMIVAASTHGPEAGVQGAEARLVRTTPSSHGGLPMFATNHPA